MKPRRIKVDASPSGDCSYDILIGDGLLGRIASDLARESLAHSCALVTDSNVEKLYGKKLFKELSAVLAKVELVSFPPGERSKNRETKSLIEDRMFEAAFGRDSCVIALGGGVVGDVAGFVAATYMRGVPCIQAPTSLVACVDSSVGGKTAVDTIHGKNLVGAFHQPWRVYVDTDTLRTLDRREISEGLAEVIKYGVIKSADLFDWLEENMEKIFALDDGALREVVESSCAIKAKVVELDEKENNLRKILNFGHTVGHAIERLSRYSLTHGEAISMGMVVEGEIALAGGGGWQEKDQRRLVGLLERAKLSTKIPAFIESGEIAKVVKIDKKARGGEAEMSLPERLGEMKQDSGSYGIKVDEKEIAAALERSFRE